MSFRVTEFGLSWGGIGCRGGDFGLSWGEIRAFVKLAGFPVEDLGLSIRGEDSAVRAEDLGFRGDSVLAFVGCSWGGFWAFVGRVSDFAWEDFGLSCGRFGLSWGGGFRAFVGLRAFAGIRAFVGGFRSWEAFGLSWGRFRAFARVLVGRLLGEGVGLRWGGFWAAFVGRDWGFRGEDLGFRGKRFRRS